MEQTVICREAEQGELQQILELYLDLHETSVPEDGKPKDSVWAQIMADPNHHVIVAVADGSIVSSCICVIIPNLTRNLRPYALIENVVTRADCRGQGLATLCLSYAKELAAKENCYKMMLLTGSKSDHTLDFYRRAGFNSTDKTAFVQWL